MRSTFGMGGRLSALAAAGIVLVSLSGASVAQTGTKPAPAPSPGTPQAGEKPAQIDRNGVLILVRSTLLAVDQANKTGNYTVLRDLGAPGFQAANTATRLGEIFAGLRNQNLDLSGIAVLDPQLTILPTIGANGMMRMAGFFPSVPMQINFELLYAPIEGRWRLFGIGLNVSQSGPSAPDAPAPAAATDDKQSAPQAAAPKHGEKVPPGKTAPR